mmetsp:Transcript_56028/g.167732  ORF Transcript_56028/g.167732 Transcript_56028/m.167732 type:complete len:250 (-) Transcript_56028:341-1090(-)
MVLASSLLVCQVDTPCSCTPIAHARLQSVPGLCIDIHDHLIYLACAVEMLMPCPLQIYQNLVLSCFCGQQYQRTEYRINCKICTEPQEPADCSSEQTCGWLCPLSVGIVTLNAHYIRTFGNLPVFLKKKEGPLRSFCKCCHLVRHTFAFVDAVETDSAPVQSESHSKAVGLFYVAVFPSFASGLQATAGVRLRHCTTKTRQSIENEETRSDSSPPGCRRLSPQAFFAVVSPSHASLESSSRCRERPQIP